MLQTNAQMPSVIYNGGMLNRKTTNSLLYHNHIPTFCLGCNAAEEASLYHQMLCFDDHF